MKRIFLFFLLVVFFTGILNAQTPRPMETELLDSVGAGVVRAELGLDLIQGAEYPFSGLEGDLKSIGNIGLRLGAGNSVELQAFWTAQHYLNINNFNTGAPNYQNLDFNGDSTNDFGDLVLATKFRFKKEGEKSPALGFRVSVKLPNSSTEKGLGTDETDVYGVFLMQKKLGGLTLAGNLGIAILGDPDSAGSQDDQLSWGAAGVYSFTDMFRVFADLHGRIGPEGYGTEERGIARFGTQIKFAGLYWDASFLTGMLDTDPDTGISIGISKDFGATIFK
jgi:Putative MetA-pathway of phenol degradation